MWQAKVDLFKELVEHHHIQVGETALIATSDFDLPLAQHILDLGGSVIQYRHPQLTQKLKWAQYHRLVEVASVDEAIAAITPSYIPHMWISESIPAMNH